MLIYHLQIIHFLYQDNKIKYELFPFQENGYSKLYRVFPTGVCPTKWKTANAPGRVHYPFANPRLHLLT